LPDAQLQASSPAYYSQYNKQSDTPPARGCCGCGWKQLIGFFAASGDGNRHSTLE